MWCVRCFVVSARASEVCLFQLALALIEGRLLGGVPLYDLGYVRECGLYVSCPWGLPRPRCPPEGVACGMRFVAAGIVVAMGL
jgi:hypothetical protein